MLRLSIQFNSISKVDHIRPYKNKPKESTIFYLSCWNYVYYVYYVYIMCRQVPFSTYFNHALSLLFPYLKSLL